MTEYVMVDLMGTIPPDKLLRTIPGDVVIKGQFGYSGHNRRKCPSPAYAAALVRSGGWYAIVFEDSAERAAQGYNAGRADAAFAVADAEAQHYPKGCTIFATADFPARWWAIAEYVHGFSEVVRLAGYQCGLYADGECVRGAKADGYIKFGWLTCSGGFPGSDDHTGVDVWQRCAGESGQLSIPGYSIDTNYVYGYIGAWGQKPPAPEWTPPEWPGADIVPGKTNDHVQAWAVLLSAIGYHGFTVKGPSGRVYGAGKVRATKRFQRRHGLKPDGKVGPKTWAAAVARLVAQRAKKA